MCVVDCTFISVDGPCKCVMVVVVGGKGGGGGKGTVAVFIVCFVFCSVVLFSSATELLVCD